MLTMPALNAIMAVEAAVEREKEQPEPRQRAIDSLRVAYCEQRDRADKAEAEARTLRNQLNLAVERSERLSEQLKGSEHRNQNLLRAVDEQRLAQQATNDLHRMLEDAGVPGVNANMTQMSLGERIGWLIGEWKHAVRRLASASKRDPEPCVRPSCTNPADLLELAWGLLANVSGGDWHQQTPTWHGAVIAWRDDWHRYLDARRKSEASVAPLLDVNWLQSEVDRLRKANRDLQERNWDLQAPDFPMLAEPPLHLHYAYMPGDWSSEADEWFTYSRLMRNGHPTKMVRVGWRHGPGIPNSDPSVPRAAKGYAGVIERLRTAEMELARLRADAFADDCKALLEGKDAKVVPVNAYSKCAFKFDEPKPVPVDPVAKYRGMVESAVDEVLAAKAKRMQGDVRDPVTGWTFDKFRRELDAARTTAKGNAGLFAQAMLELAAAKGGA